MDSTTSIHKVFLYYCICVFMCVLSDSSSRKDNVSFKPDKLIQGQSEIVFLLDRSGSVGAGNFEVQKGFVESLLAQVAVSPNASRVAVISYSALAVRHIDYIKEPKNKCFLSLALQDILYENSGKTNTEAALVDAYEVFKNARANVSKVAILVSDGLHTAGKDPIHIAKKLKESGVEIFAFGIGRFLKNELQRLATSADHVFECPDFRDFKRLAQRIRGDLHETKWSEDKVRNCDPLCDSPYRGQEDDPGCCDHVAKCACSLFSGSYDCICGPGYYGLNGVMGQCKPCPASTYKDTYEPTMSCKPCPAKATTRDVASKSVKDCYCVEGYQGDPGKGIPCTLQECPPLQSPANGRIRRSTGNKYRNMYLFACNEGYELQDPTSVVRTCGKNGEWSQSPATCQRVLCPELPDPSNGHKRCNRTQMTIGTTCFFSCNEGYFLSQTASRVCQVGKQWSGKDVICKPVECSVPNPPRFGALLNCAPRQKFQYGHVCSITCNEGFRLEGAHFMVCNKKGNWVDRLNRLVNSVCKDIERPKIQCPPNQDVIAEPGRKDVLVTWTLPTVSDNTGLEPELSVSPKNIRPRSRLPIGVTTVTYKAEDRHKLSSFCQMTITVKDVEAPKVISCPTKVEVNTTDIEVSVQWDEPIFRDNSGEAVRIDSSAVPGDKFEPDRHTVEYVATDSSGNKARCTFDVIVTKHHCPFYPAPVNGALTCDDWLYGQFCQVYCNEEFDFIATPAEWYICDSTTEWKTTPPNSPIPWPDCASKYIPRKARRSLTGQYYSGNCHDPKVQTQIKNLFLKHFMAKFNTTQYCSKEGSCSIDVVKVTCGRMSNDNINRVRRNVWSFPMDDMMEIEVEITVDSGQKREPSKEVILELMEALNTLVKNMEEDTVEGKITLAMEDDPRVVVLDTAALDVGQSKFICFSGAILKDDECVHCPQGTFHNYTSDTCDDCPIGQFQDEEAQVACKLCPAGTLTEGARSRNDTECKAFCLPGTYSTTGLETCEACPAGMYQDEPGQITCKPCPSLTTTWTVGATDVTWCREQCTPGSFSYTGLMPCEPCPIGHYQQEVGKMICEECPGNFTTVGVESTALESCVEHDHCSLDPCDNGALCISDRHSFTCVCVKGFEGPTCNQNVDECLEEPCANNATCIDMLAFFICECAPGFGGVLCDEEVDECLSSPCVNGGVCVDKVAHFECICPAGYEGPLCEIDIDLCARQPCANGASCEEVNDTRICYCQPGFEGEDCSINTNDCVAVICNNGGRCIDLVQRYQCSCAPGFTGLHCEFDIDDCLANHCENGATCEDGVDGYTCLCAPGFSGLFCEKRLSPEFVMNFPYPSTSNFAVLPNLLPLPQVSVGMWTQTLDQHRPGTMLSYATTQRQLDNALTFTDYGGLKVYVNNQPVYTDLQLNDGKWHQVTFTWSSAGGKWNVYHNGTLVSSGQDLQSNQVIPGGGSLVIGQEQDCVGGGFSSLEAFTGNLSRVNVWNRVLTTDEVQGLCHMKEDIPGRVAAWPDFRRDMRGQIRLHMGTRPWG